jgi:hypothetical protein
MNLVEGKRKKQLFGADEQKMCELAKKAENLNYKNLVDKIHKLIFKELKLNVNHNVKTGKNHNLLQV